MPQPVSHQRTTGAVRLPVEDVLRRAAIAINSSLELGDVLELFAAEILGHTDAQRASIFLVDVARDGTPLCLRPAVSIGRRVNPVLHAVFRAQERVNLDDHQRRAFVQARAVQIADADACPLIPGRWVSRFKLESVVLLPLFAKGQPCGLVAVDYPRRQRFAQDEVALLEALGEFAALAILNASEVDRTRERTRLRECLSMATAALAPPLDRPTIARMLAESMRDLLQAELAMVGFLGRDACIQPVATAGDHPLPGPVPLTAVPARIVTLVGRAWTAGITDACELPADHWLLDGLGLEAAVVDGFVLLPLLANGRPAGAVLVGVRGRWPLGADARSAAETLAAIAGTALERQMLLASSHRQVRRLEEDIWLAATHLEPSGGWDLPAALRRLKTILQDHSTMDVAWHVATRHTRLPLEVERLLFGAVRHVLGAVHASRSDGVPADAPPVDVRVAFHVGRRRAHVTVAIEEAPEGINVPVVEACAALRPDFGAAGGWVAPERSDTGALTVTAWLQRDARVVGTGQRQLPSRHNPYGLTDRELQVLALLVERRTNAEIAQHFRLTVNTVKSHVAHILDKLDVRSRYEAARKAGREGLVVAGASDLLAQRSLQRSDDNPQRA